MTLVDARKRFLSSVTTECPVCWRGCTLTDARKVRFHRDTRGEPCPMSGKELPPHPLEPLTPRR
ncbi:hypothetical protein [Rhodococcus sp. LW-XY12]|uniref:hypothetical protein n=1 Tax=Rhodococcus sp. LW-XY12 TaxID=2856851 RepID=UPI001C5A3713|nr:hypothetical protein [Rhodococcus sp. LW-XY12]QXU53631.1 hypothetical protein KXC42_23385 [Rhodococcus sp. LW-XY12]